VFARVFIEKSIKKQTKLDELKGVYRHNFDEILLSMVKITVYLCLRVWETEIYTRKMHP